MSEILACPECGEIKQVTTTFSQMLLVNSGRHYCTSMKTHDADSPANCLKCSWKGERKDLKPAIK
ncbi:MAG: hypothetical protein IBX50_17185 [Marinospirillum sp.]|uniref:hypothetical protein n=1 Tax=Marinospirillum sp. TaxID=2183934 RepID=UPI0019DFDB05|nr:hypothetical protein [Marinospirillum sp.]MBE0508426.1 hypothetical protein [Marinospirillum sp.]